MKSEMKRLFLVSAIAAASVSMTACGGGGGGTDKPEGDPVTGDPVGGGSADGTVRIQKTGKAVPKEEANLGRTSGIWLSRYEIYGEGAPRESGESAEPIEYSTQISSVRYVSDDEVIVDDCDTEAPVTLTLEAFKDTLNEKDEYVDADPSKLPCNGEMEYEYFERSDTDYRVEMVCRGELRGMSEMKQISSQTEYNQGSLSFVADRGENLTTNGGVCGYIENIPPDDDNPFSNSGIIELVAPYQNTKIELFIETNTELQEGVFEVDGFGDAGSMTADVALEIASNDDEDEDEEGDDEDDDSEDEFDPYVQGGSLNIESVDAYRASGSFDLILDDESRVQGNFSLDLQ